MRSPSTRTAGLVTFGLSLATAAAAGLHAPTDVWIGTAVAAGACLVAAVCLHVREGHARPVVSITQQPIGTAAKLAEAAKVGRRLLAEAGELEPMGNLPHVEDLVRRYNAWKGGVADVLADDDLPSEWRNAWLTDDLLDTFPITREALDRMARAIGGRLRLIGQLICALREAQR